MRTAFSQKKQTGFTFIELIVVLGMLGTLLGIVIINLLSATQKTSLRTTITTLVSDLARQQIRAMAQDTQGIYFETEQYTLFRGPSYVAADSTNAVIPLGNGIEIINILFPSSQIVFVKGSGEIAAFSSGNNAITVRNTTNGEEKVITLNRFGVVTGVQ